MRKKCRLPNEPNAERGVRSTEEKRVLSIKSASTGTSPVGGMQEENGARRNLACPSGQAHYMGDGCSAAYP